jgi:outer membrane protein insertion porin family/translocation and assembly module TamA
MHSTIRVFATLALAAGGAFGSAARAQTPRDDRAEMEAPEVRELRIRGVRAVSEGDLRESLATEASSCLSLLLRPFCLVTKSKYVYERRYLDREEFQRDVIRLLVFYFRRGYRDAQVDTAITDLGSNQVRVTLDVREGPPTRVTEETVADSGGVLTPREIARELRPKEGQPINLLALDSSVIRLRNVLFERGYADATIVPTVTVDDSTDAALVRLDVDPRKRNTITEVRIEGNQRVTEETIRNSLLVEPGDLFRRSEIGRSQRALYESNLFRRAVIDTAPGGTDSTKALVVRVQEGPLREARLRAGFTTADFFQADALFTHNYWLGGARRLDLSATVGNLLAQQLTRSRVFVDISDMVEDGDLGRYYAPTYQASADVRQRWFQSPRNTIGAGIFTHRRSSPGVFVDRGYGANATITRELLERTPLSATYRFEIARVQAGDVYFCVNYGVCDDPTIDALRGQQRLSPLAFTLSMDRTDAPFSPTRGILARAEAEHASAYTTSDFRYNRAFADVAMYRQVPFRNAVAAGHVRAGWVSALASTGQAVGAVGGEADILHPRKRFYAGGAQSVRGFGENQLGPRVLTVSPRALEAAGCDVSSVAGLRACDLSFRENPNGEGVLLSDNAFQSRPLGGTTLLEGSIELRVPVWGPIVGALFLDGAILGESSLRGITKGTGAITPGFGVRYLSPVGPIRVDLGIRPTLQEALPVITQITDSTGRNMLVELSPTSSCREDTTGCRTYPSPDAKPSFLTRITNRLTLHLSIGEAF